MAKVAGRVVAPASLAHRGLTRCTRRWPPAARLPVLRTSDACQSVSEGHEYLKQYTSTVRDGALEIAFKKFAGGLGPDSLARIRNQGRRSEGLLEIKRRAAGAQNLATLRRRPVPRTRSAITLTRHLT